MSTEILINATPAETRVALIEQGLLQEIHIERHRRLDPVGNIIVGKVVRVMPGMQAAFVDIGLERAGFIHAADIVRIDEDGYEVFDNEGEQPSINELLHEGQMLLVQVIKEPIATKGARLTTHLSLASRYLVCMPRSGHIGASLRIDNEEERERLLSQLKQLVDEAPDDQRRGFILRTAAEGAGSEELMNDMRFLSRLWTSIEKKIHSGSGIRTVHHELELSKRAVRDLYKNGIDRIRIDDGPCYEALCQFVHELIPEAESCLELYREERPLFDLFAIDDEIEKALGKTVRLKSGGNLVIDQTESMTTIDVNTGAFLGTRNQAETILKTNLEAANAIVRQLKVRNLGGIIIIDFIDMLDDEHRRQVLRALNKALEKDRARTRTSEMSEFGLVEMTRKRSHESLEQMLCHTCPSCHGRGSVKTPETVCYEVFREIMRVARAFENNELLVMASQEVVDRLLDEESAEVAELEELTGKHIGFQVESMYTTEQFDVVVS